MAVENKTTLHYGESKIAEIVAGQKAIIPSTEKTMLYDVSVSAGGNASVSHNGLTVASLSSGQHAVLNCALKTCMGNIIVRFWKDPTPGLAYTLDGSRYICTGIGSATDTDIVIASEINGIPVREIAAEAFALCKAITSVCVPSTVDTIGRRAFSGCTSLESISLPFVGGTVMKNNWFGYIFGADTYTDNNVKAPSSLKEVEITCDGTLSYGAFMYCLNIESLSLPEGLQSIPYSAFQGCTSLATLRFDGTVEYWTQMVERPEGWNRHVPATKVICSDGEADL